MSVILVSGGLDSATALAWALRNTKEPHIPISFFYGQRHAKEQYFAQELCSFYKLPAPRHINLAQTFLTIGGSSLTSGVVHGNPSVEEINRTSSELPPTFVPGRNIIMLSVAAAVAYVEKTYDIVGGWNAVDYSGYPDCRYEFMVKMESALNEGLGLKEFTSNSPHISIRRPLESRDKAQIIKMGLDMNVPYHLTWSCYAGNDVPCGECDSCRIRIAGFAKVGIADPALQ